jgi:LuxR family transcriptional regulator, maltose regulon positive regulatory protein
MVRQVLLAAAAIERGDPAVAGMTGDLLQAARCGGFLGTVVTTAPQVTRYLVEHSAQMAGTLFISRNTVKTHLQSIYQKLGVSSRSDAIERAVDLRLL